jgi:hypothetical protein
MMLIDRLVFTPEATTEVLAAILARDPIGENVKNHGRFTMMNYRDLSRDKSCSGGGEGRLRTHFTGLCS